MSRREMKPRAQIGGGISVGLSNNIADGGNHFPFHQEAK